ncbi:MAG: hypothetical protein LBL58_09275 [Tannerellaceae bacterium]|jgi:hypothetical protein|nr:hypothetical protein [Tannerellaceae bacterium]
MKNILLSLVVFLLWVNSAGAQEGYWPKYADAGWQPASSEYKINTAAQLAQLAILVNNGERFEDVTFTLESDIDLSAHYWTPVGEENTTPFCGTFDGKNHTIEGLLIDNNITDYWGVYSALFGRIAGKAHLKNIILGSGLIKGGMGDGTLTASLIADVLTEDTQPVRISSCYNLGVVVIAGSGARGGRTGGLIASIRTESEATAKTSITIEECVNNADVTGICTSSYTGGLIGFVSAGNHAEIVITDCYNDANVKGTKDCTGGLAGRMQASSDANVMLVACMAGATIQGGEGYTGGLVGHLKASGTNSIAKVKACSVSAHELKGNNEFTHIFIGKNENGTLEDNQDESEN